MFLNREKVSGALLNNRAMKKLAREHLDEMGIRIPSVNVEVAKLSGGQRQAIAVARSVFSDPKILLLDEPLAAMGVKEGAIILDLVRQLKEQGEVSIIIIAHNYGQVLEVCDRVNLVQHGEITFDKRSADTSVDRADRDRGGRVPQGPGRTPARSSRQPPAARPRLTASDLSTSAWGHRVVTRAACCPGSGKMSACPGSAGPAALLAVAACASAALPAAWPSSAAYPPGTSTGPSAARRRGRPPDRPDGRARWTGTTARSAGSWDQPRSAPGCRSRSTTATRAGARSRWPCRRPRPPPRPVSSWATCWSTRAVPAASGRSLAAAVETGLSPAWPAGTTSSASTRAGSASSVPALSCDPGFFSGVRPNYVPANAAAEQVLENRAKTYAADCEQKFGWLLPVHDHRGRGPRHGLDPVRAGRSRRSATTPSPTAPTSARSTPRCSPAGSTAWCWTAPSTRPGVWYTDNIEQDYAFQGRHGGLLRLDGEVRQRLPAGQHRGAGPAGLVHARSQLLAHPSTGPTGSRSSARTSSTTRSCSAGTERAVARPGPGPVQLPAAGPDQRAGQPVPGERRPGRERVRRLQRRAVLGRQLAAQLVQVGQRHPQGLHRPPPTRPGTTPGTTRPARSGRSRARPSR